MGGSFPMKGGDGGDSYANNSQIQKQCSDSVKGMIQEAVAQCLDAGSSELVAIADLGCSVGPNTFFSVQTLIEALENKLGNIQEIQVYFNDHSANDFNTLFASLPADRKYYAAGVPGSFQGRLFPRGSITVAHSAHALQWLSKQPQGVANEGRVHYGGACAEVVGAYLDQFNEDMGGFMSARAEEIARGGLMFLILPGTPDGISHSDNKLAALFSFFGASLLDLAEEGVVETQAIHSFNLPIYFPTLREVREVVEKNGCFSIERVELPNPDANGSIDVAVMIRALRAGLEGVFTAHFQASAVDQMFAKMSQKAQQISHRWEATYHNFNLLSLVLKRK